MNQQSQELHPGTSTENTTPLGVVKLHQYSMSLCIGDPYAILSEDGRGKDSAVWEKVSKSSKWTFKDHTFDYGDRNRKTFKWVRTSPYFSPRVMELKVEGVEEVLAVWMATGRFKSRCRNGSLWVRREMTGVEGEEEESKFEVLVLLSAMGILEAIARHD
jgi:hypothetical protein